MEKAKQFVVNHKKIVILASIAIIAFIIWKTAGPKTVESGNGWKHQIGEFGQCEFLDCENEATHRYRKATVQEVYCDECWELYGREMFNRLADKSSNGNSSSSDATDAKICAVKAVEDRLKTPSTADFCSYSDMTATNLGGNKWKITGYVDAQNSFGATLREYWTVTLTLTDSGFKDYTVTFD